MGCRGAAPSRRRCEVVRDPVCGNLVPPRESLALTARGATHTFAPTHAATASGRAREQQTQEQIRAEIVEVGRRMYARGFVASNDGNISARLDGTRLLTTPKSVSKGFMTPDMMVVVDFEGRKIGGDRDPSSELPMHLEIYRNRPDVNGVVHAHPPTANGFAVPG